MKEMIITSLLMIFIFSAIAWLDSIMNRFSEKYQALLQVQSGIEDARLRLQHYAVISGVDARHIDSELDKACDQVNKEMDRIIEDWREFRRKSDEALAKVRRFKPWEFAPFSVAKMGGKWFEAASARPRQIFKPEMRPSLEVFTLYRFEHPEHGGGMWYNGDGSYNGDIFKLSEGKAKTFGMEYDEKYSEKGNWISAVKDLNQLLEWFSKKDMEELADMGYKLYQIEATRVIVENDQVLFDKDAPHIKREVYFGHTQQDIVFPGWCWKPY